MLHRRGVGRCLAPACQCLYAPAKQKPSQKEEPLLRVTTVDESGVVQTTRRERSARERQFRLSDQEKLERALWQRMEWAGLPLPVLEYHWAKSEGRQFRSDGAYVVEKILLEVDGGIWMRGGGGHSHPMHLEKQHERDNLAALLGWTLLRFTERMIKNGSAVKDIERAFTQAKAAAIQPTEGETT